MLRFRRLTRALIGDEAEVKSDVRRTTRAVSMRWSDADVKHDIRRTTRVIRVHG